jgi:hypothetical protein
METRKVLAITSILFLQLTTGSLAHADITYYYTGNPYNVGAITYDYSRNPYNTIDFPALGSNLTASVTFDSVVTENFSGLVGSSDIVSWSITSGPITITTGLGVASEVEFVFSNGVITSWIWSGATGPFLAFSAGSSDGFNEDYITQGFVNFSTSLLGKPGTWSAAVPEPATMLLLGSGLLGIWGTRKKFRK